MLEKLLLMIEVLVLGGSWCCVFVILWCNLFYICCNCVEDLVNLSLIFIVILEWFCIEIDLIFFSFCRVCIVFLMILVILLEIFCVVVFG